MKLPIINKTYNHFDDGKIRESRRDTVLIKEIIPFDDIDTDTLKMWEDDVENCDWLYEKQTDYFIKGYLKETKEEIIYVRTKNYGWFSLGYWAGRLDLDGSLVKMYDN